MQPADPKQCGAKTRGGKACRTPPMAGQKRCRMHGASAPQCIEAAKRRLLEALDPAAAELVRIAKGGKRESDRLRAIEGIMDRAGLPASSKQEVTGEGGAPVVVELAWKPKPPGKEGG